MAADQTQSPPFVLDLNQSPPSDPSPSNPPVDSYGRVLNYHNSHFTPSKESMAQFPGEAGISGAHKLRKCGIYEKEEVWEATVVCDGCETGFHLECLKLGQMGAAIGADWVCGECQLSGPTQKRWVLGPVRLLDINAPPPGEGEDDCFQSMKASDMFNINLQLEHLQAKYLGTGHVELSRFEWVVNIQPNSYVHINIVGLFCYCGERMNLLE